MNDTDKKKKFSPVVLMFIGILAGCTAGAFWDKAQVLKPLGTIYINMMFCVVVPLVFFSIASSIGSLEKSEKGRKIITYSISYFVITAVLASIFAFLFLNLFSFGSELDVSGISSSGSAAPVNAAELIVGIFTQSDFTELFSRRAILPLLTAAVLFGLGIQRSGGANSPTAILFTNIYECLLNTVRIINKLAPIGFFGFFAGLVSDYGAKFIGEYGKLFVLICLADILYFCLAAPIYSFFGAGRDAVRIMLKNIFKVIAVSFGSCSSVASIPTNLEISDASGIPRDVSNIVIPLGATVNMNGTAIATVGKIIFLSAVFGIKMGAEDFLLALFIGVITSVATSRVPGGGSVSAMILASVFFPGHLEMAYAVSVAVGNMLDPFSTMVNASLDYVASFVVTRFVYSKDWLKNG